MKTEKEIRERIEDLKEFLERSKQVSNWSSCAAWDTQIETLKWVLED